MKRLVLTTALVLLQSGPGLAQTNYFLVGPLGGVPSGDLTNTFVLPLTKPADVDYARRLAGVYGGAGWTGTLGVYEYAPIFEVRLGSDGLNRDLWAPGQPLWSWHVGELSGWGGTFIPTHPFPHPRDLERAVLAGVVEDGERWAIGGPYTVIEELTSEVRLFTYTAPGRQGVAFYWTHTEPGKRYQIEWTPTLAPAQWQPLSLEAGAGEYWSYRIIFVYMERHPGGYFRLRVDPTP